MESHDVGRSLRDGLSPQVEPASGLDGSATSIPSADTGLRASLHGFVYDMSSKCGVRYVHFDADSPYRHTVFLEITGDPGAEDDDSLTEALFPFCKGRVHVLADIDINGDLFATPSRFSRAPEIAASNG